MRRSAIARCRNVDPAPAQEFALLSILLGVIACSGTLLWAGSALGLIHLTTVVIFLGLVGVWVVLQFGWLYREEPDAVILLERCVSRLCVPLPACVSSSAWVDPIGPLVCFVLFSGVPVVSCRPVACLRLGLSPVGFPRGLPVLTRA